MTGDHYKTLGIQRNASEDDVKKAYRKLAKQFHPDKNKNPGAEETFKKIGAAYEVLKDPTKKRTYDLQRDGDEEYDSFFKTSSARNRAEFSGAYKGDNGDANSKPSYGEPFKNRNYTSSFPNFRDQQGANKTPRFNGNNPTAGQFQPGRGARCPRGTRFHFSRPQWNNDFNDLSDSGGEHQDIFHPFVFFDQMHDLIHGFFCQAFAYQGGQHGANNLGSRRPKANDLDTSSEEEEDPDLLEDMWDWNKPMFGARRPGNKASSPPPLVMQCCYCTKLIRPSELLQHEEMCKRLHNGRTADESAQFVFGKANKSRTSYKDGMRDRSQPKDEDIYDFITRESEKTREAAAEGKSPKNVPQYSKNFSGGVKGTSYSPSATEPKLYLPSPRLLRRPKLDNKLHGYKKPTK